MLSSQRNIEGMFCVQYGPYLWHYHWK